MPILISGVTSDINIDENELEFAFIRASGPGGQNVNKVASAVQLRFDIRNSASLPEDVRDRLVRLAGKRVTEAGVLIIEAKQHRTQEQNRQAAIERFANLVRKAAEPPKARKKTRPTLASQKKRLETKSRRSAIKRQRSPSAGEGGE